MNFDFSEEQKLLAHSGRQFLADRAPLAVCRAALEAERGHDADLWTRMAEMGWLGTTIDEAFGGAGMGPLELAVIAEQIGHALAPVPFVGSVALFGEAVRLHGSKAQRSALLPGVAAGTTLGCMAWADRFGEGPAAGGRRYSDGRIRGECLDVIDAGQATHAVVLAEATPDPVLVIVDLSGPGVARRGRPGLDPSRSVATLVFDDAEAETLPVSDAVAAAERLLERAAVVIAFEQLGGAARAFELTRAFCLDRHAFGRPIASFQAVKHRLADRWVDVELARSNAYYGAWALATDAQELSLAAATARVSASTAFRNVTEDMIQLHGGVGYTWEYDGHLFYRRARFLESALGTVPAWRSRVVEHADRAFSEGH